jgi:Putative auto-transporter adhesin, head GIN domain
MRARTRTRQFRGEELAWWLGLLGLLIGGLIASLPAHAGSAPAERQETYTASRLAVAGLVGSLRVERHDGADMRLVLRGSAHRLDRIQREVQGDRLQLIEEPGATGSTTVVSGANNVVIARNGGQATQIIGGVATSAGGEAEPPLEIVAYVPAATPLTVTGMVGDLVVEGVGGPVDLELIAGQAQLDRATGGSLAAVGGSRIELAEATGDLKIAVQGAGDVRIAQADLARLEVGVSGTGDVAVGGVAEQASVEISGIGGVQIDQVRTRPKVSVTGIGHVEIGNW